MAMIEIVAKLNRILDGLMGCSLEFQPASDLSLDNWNESELLPFLENSRSEALQYIESVNGSQVAFPVNLQGRFAGLAVVNGWKDSKPRELLLLAELMTMMIEYSLSKEDRNERLRLIEERIQLMDESSNVIPLRPSQFSRVLQLTEPEIRPIRSKSPLTSMPLLIETKPGFPLHRIALEVHNQSGRWAFVSAEDLPPDIFDSRKNLEQLGSVTLFIRDLSILTTNQQLKLAEYLAIKPSADMPHVIAGVNSPIQELENKRAVLQALLGLFCKSTLQWTEKSTEEITSDLVNASLRHILEQTRESHQVGSHIVPFHIQYFDPDHSTVH